MAKQIIKLEPVTKDDVGRIRDWLSDDEVAQRWFGRYSYGNPAHLGYHPDRIASASDDEWGRTFNDPAHRILSIRAETGEHIGEVHVAIEEALGDGQLSILIGRKDLWQHGYGTAGAEAALEACFGEWGLYRVWVDVPEYNKAARTMFEHLGFVHEGTLRKSRPHEGARFDSVVMGILASEHAAHVHPEGAHVV
jgi:RimJ/RimL family protein N-acetyltransferase